jgi:AcrR family transcriptional regulator
MFNDRDGGRSRDPRKVTDSEKWIFEATEELLDEVPLRDITVAMIAEAAGVSRQTFYTHFSSKYEVVTALLEDVMHQIVGAVGPFIEMDPRESPVDALRKSFDAATDLWVEHRMILGAASENWHAVPELRERWTALWDQAIDITAALLDEQRAAGVAPPGPASRQLASTMLWGAERALYIAGLQSNPDMDGEKAIIESLVRLWYGAFYASPPEASDALPAGASASARKRRSGPRKA